MSPKQRKGRKIETSHCSTGFGDEDLAIGKTAVQLCKSRALDFPKPRTEW
jgi:hypothetical protein